MKWQFIATIDTDDGDYEVEFKNLSDPGSGVEYGQLMDALGRVLTDLQGRVDATTREILDANEGEEEIEIYLLGDEQDDVSFN